MRGASFVKLLDFGIAKVIGGDESLTVTGQIMGTPHYMSPEQWLRVPPVSPGRDLWAAGMVLAQLFGGTTTREALEQYWRCVKRKGKS